MRLTIVGCSGSFPGPGGPASCYLVEAAGFRLLLDLGNGAVGVLQRYAGLYDIDAICLSHLHADHCLDLCCYAVGCRYAPGGRGHRTAVYAPAGTARRMASAYGDQGGDAMTECFDFTDLRPGTMEIGPLRVTVDHMNHPVETFGFRIEHSGRALAYSADSGESAALVELARDADLMLCEASFLERPDLPVGVHLTGRQAAEHAARAGAGRLVLTHLVAWNDQARTAEEAGAAFSGPMTLAASGMSFTLD